MKDIRTELRWVRCSWSDPKGESRTKETQGSLDVLSVAGQHGDREIVRTHRGCIFPGGGERRNKFEKKGGRSASFVDEASVRPIVLFALGRRTWNETHHECDDENDQTHHPRKPNELKEDEAKILVSSRAWARNPFSSRLVRKQRSRAGAQRRWDRTEVLTSGLRNRSESSFFPARSISSDPVRATKDITFVVAIAVPAVVPACEIRQSPQFAYKG